MTPVDRFSLAGRVALVTGASSGLGRHFAGVLAGQGAAVLVGARRTERLGELVEEITAGGGRAVAVPMDVTDRDSIAAAFDMGEKHLGTVDLLVNNAGIANTADLESETEADWDRVVDTNLKAVWMVAVELVRRLPTDHPASIVNIASILGLRVSRGVGSYIASKSAVVQLTRTMALEWGRRGIRTNAIAPGYFETELNEGFFDTEAGQKMQKRIPAGRIGELAELDGPLLLLASDAGSYMNGSVLVADGGHLCSSL